MSRNTRKREGFSSGLAVFFATLSSAVGLGNIWKFPYLTGDNGGGAFLIIYIAFALLLGIPVMMCEFYIGRSTKRNAVGAFDRIKPGSLWKIIGYAGLLSAYLIMFFYSSVAGWVYSYIFKSIRGTLSHLSTEDIQSIFDKTVSSSFEPIFWQVFALAVVGSILVLGVRNGIERLTKILMPILFILIIICDIRALTLPGSLEGIKFLFYPDFSSLTKNSILIALGLAFFKLSLGMGTMITYSSYFTDDNNMLATSLKVAFSDLCISLLAGIAIFPTVFTFGVKVNSGPGLLFKTIPLVFSKLPFGNILMTMFFILTAIAATTAMMSIVEVTVAILTEELKISRKSSVMLNCLIIAVFGSLATLSSSSSSLLADIKIFGKTFFDFFDYVSSNVLLPLGGLLIAVFTGYIIKKEKFIFEISNKNSLEQKYAFSLLFILIKYVTPFLLLIILLNSLSLIN